jgi:hypothetical protein
MTDDSPRVGTLREAPLHASLKRWCARDGDRLEVPVDGFVVDLVRDDVLIEVQTRGFSSLKRKLTALLERGHRVRIVHPIPARKWIIKVDGDGEEIDRRKSPKHGDYVDVFAELVSFPALVTHPGLTIEILLTHEEEYRFHDPARAWRRRGWVVRERRLVGVVDGMEIDGPDDLASLLPEGLPDPFTTADLAALLSRPRRVAQQMAYCLRHAGVIEEAGRQGNAIEYRIARGGS